MRKLEAQFVSRLKPLIVVLDASNQIEDVHGDLRHYGYNGGVLGSPVASMFDFMVGLAPPVSLDFPFVETPSGRIAQIQIELDQHVRRVVLVDVTDHHREVQTQQQLANDYALALRRLLRLEMFIGCMFQHDDLCFWSWDIPRDRLRLDSQWVDVGEQVNDPGAVCNWNSLVHREDVERVQNVLQEYLQRQSAYFAVEYRLRASAEKRESWVLTRGTVAEHDAEGRPTCLIGIQLNIDQRKETEIALQESEQRFRMMADTAPVLVWMSDHAHNSAYFNRGWLEFTGRSLRDEIDHGWCRNIHPDDRDYCEETSQAAMSHLDSFELEYRFLRADGEYRWLLDRGVPRFDADGNFLGYIGTCVDITERVNAHDALRELSADLECRVEERTAELEATNTALRESEERYALVAQATEEGLWDWDLNRNEIYYSPRWKAIMGLRSDDECNAPSLWEDRIHQDDLSMVIAERDKHLAGLDNVYACEYRMLHADGTYHWFHQRALAVRDASGRPYRIAGSHRDVSHRKAIEEQLLFDAIHDGLTGLANRTLLMDRLCRCIERRRRDEESTFALLFMDLDRFKIVNDSLGHVIGDRLLVSVAQRLRRLLRAQDTLARLGGDEFAILLEDIRGHTWAVQVAERINAELSQAFDIDGNEIHIGASVGIALSSSNYQRAEDMIRDADTAMYRAKAQGVARHQVFDSRMHAGAVRRLRLENDLRSAIEREQLEVHFQPVVNVSNGGIVGFEALLRWQHPEFGMVAPTEFISLAEETGLIVPIGAWVLRTTCMQAYRWQTAGAAPLRVAVNLSSVQFRHSDLTETIRSALQESRLDPGWLDLEVTESTLMSHMDSAISTMRELKELGLMLSMDDFGTGYSSLSCLKHFPLDTLKIDQSFVRDIATDPSDAAIVTAIGAMAVSLNMDVIAEGVETMEQLQFLAAHDCHKAQGYLFSPPVTAEGVLLMLTDRTVGPTIRQAG